MDFEIIILVGHRLKVLKKVFASSTLCSSDDMSQSSVELIGQSTGEEIMFSCLIGLRDVKLQRAISQREDGHWDRR